MDFTIKAKSDMPGTAQGGVVKVNGTTTETTGTTSTTGNGIAQAGITGRIVNNNNTAANPVTDTSSTEAASGSGEFPDGYRALYYQC